MSRQVVIVGGYGQVGREVARALAPEFPGRVVIAGRSQARAEALAARLGHGVRGMALDVEDAAAVDRLHGAALVVMCVDQTRDDFVRACLAAGLDYVDVTARHASLVAFERLDVLAREAGSTAVLSVGLAPGVSNVLAAMAAERLARVERMDLFVLLGAGDVHGDAAVAWTLDQLDAPFEVLEGGRARRVRGFGERAWVRLPEESRPRAGWRFAFPDQHVVARTLGIPTVSTWLCLDPPWLTGLVALAVRLGLGRVLRVPTVRRCVTWLLHHVRVGSEACAVVARARGQDARGDATRECALVGRREAALTGSVLVEVCRELLGGNRPGGVLHLDRLPGRDALLQRVADANPGTRVFIPPWPASP
ncbi:saccharopine dehydrogenase NADP-binding domain-containing protein [Myxococcus sp. K15C18031901]|uniref:saccharopine dehydrogenase family protein n=1 Tax=Myxococcus dinghuensis TaxID=2906761 RepID=UPI0020A73545|nr:saccharopine dehydrogenase NADP-binding domain-containing protein [Myxococcus dinghuensis]MCP3097415.1 saccharopine dehydrogenase NADP-binding domain-containing protein [Myxococcus dinghuensis]